MGVFVLDERYFALNLLVTVGIQMSGFVVAALTKSEKLFDFAGGLNFIVIALLTLCLEGSYNSRSVVCVAIVCVSRAYLAGFLAFRVFKRKGDSRFENVRGSALATFLAYSYQIVWVYAVSSPVIFIVGTGNGGNDQLDGFEPSDYVGAVVASLGGLCEVVADVQKFLFRSEPANSQRACDQGLWSLSRHPNYLGEVTLWWGIFVLGVAVFLKNGSGWATIVSPIFTMVLLLVGSGIPTAEGSALKRFYATPESTERFTEYFESTPPLLCCCCGLYRLLPGWAKLVCCCELPMYRYSPEGAQAEASTALSGDGPADDIALPVSASNDDVITDVMPEEVSGSIKPPGQSM